MRQITLLLLTCFGMACAGSPAQQPDAVEDKNIYIHRPISAAERAAERSIERARELERAAAAEYKSKRARSGPPWRGSVTAAEKVWDRQYITISFGNETLLRLSHHVKFFRRGRPIGSARITGISDGESECIASSALDVMVGDDVLWDDDTEDWDWDE